MLMLQWVNTPPHLGRIPLVISNNFTVPIELALPLLGNRLIRFAMKCDKGSASWVNIYQNSKKHKSDFHFDKFFMRNLN